uniref:DDE Tnp4 domain-containing protein n=1 Tax=Neogobius melanostomus TaxID=47308 RepID=A0A8C6WUD9_9GOBI
MSGSNTAFTFSELFRENKPRTRGIVRAIPSTWPRSTQWWHIVVLSFTEGQWIAHFRMSEDTFTFLCNKVRPAMERENTTYRECVPVRKRVAIALWKLATGSAYRTIGEHFGVSMSTVYRCVRDFCAAAQLLLVPEQILGSATMRGCCGWVSYSDFRRCDARVLRLSILWELASWGIFDTHTRNIRGVPTGYYLLSDSAYPLQKWGQPYWLLKPFSDTGNLTAAQQLYNRTTSRARVAVENAFSRLKGRWRCLLKRNVINLSLVKSTVYTCCALHNLCERHGETYDTEWHVPLDAAAAVPMATQGAEEDGRGLHEALMGHLLSN